MVKRQTLPREKMTLSFEEPWSHKSWRKMLYERSKRVSDSLPLVFNVVKRVLLLIQLIHVTYTNGWDYDASFSRDENGYTIFMGPRIVLLCHSFSFTKEHRRFVMHLTGLALVKSNLYLIRIIFFIIFLYVLSTWLRNASSVSL